VNCCVSRPSSDVLGERTQTHFESQTSTGDVS
jgi:hypothetical protein